MIHRVWDVDIRIKISFYPDRVEILSPGGLPTNVSQNIFNQPGISTLRNRTLAQCLFRAVIVESFGTGLARVQQLYRHSIKRPEFEATTDFVKVILPVITDASSLNEEEVALLRKLNPIVPMSTKALVDELPYKRTKITKLLNELSEKDLVVKEGGGRTSRYLLKL